jgi:uncharacterized protein (DUF2384 family)
MMLFHTTAHDCGGVDEGATGKRQTRLLTHAVSAANPITVSLFPPETNEFRSFSMRNRPTLRNNTAHNQQQQRVADSTRVMTKAVAVASDASTPVVDSMHEEVL